MTHQSPSNNPTDTMSAANNLITAADSVDELSASITAFNDALEHHQNLSGQVSTMEKAVLFSDAEAAEIDKQYREKLSKGNKDFNPELIDLKAALIQEQGAAKNYASLAADIRIELGLAAIAAHKAATTYNDNYAKAISRTANHFLDECLAKFLPELTIGIRLKAMALRLGSDSDSQHYKACGPDKAEEYVVRHIATLLRQHISAAPDELPEYLPAELRSRLNTHGFGKVGILQLQRMEKELTSERDGAGKRATN